jgi:hypothetical protein
LFFFATCTKDVWVQRIRDITNVAVAKSSSLTPLDAWQLVQAHIRLAALLEGPVDLAANSFLRLDSGPVDVNSSQVAQHPAQEVGHEHWPTLNSNGLGESGDKACVAPSQRLSQLLSPDALENLAVRFQNLVASRARHLADSWSSCCVGTSQNSPNNSAHCRVIALCFRALAASCGGGDYGAGL